MTAVTGPPFAIGDVVRCRGIASPAMTVRAMEWRGNTEQYAVICQWFDDMDLQDGIFAAASLRLVVPQRQDSAAADVPAARSTRVDARDGCP